MMTRLRQFLCWLVDGHLPVTKSSPASIYQQCYLCDRVIGPGWAVPRARRRRRRQKVEPRKLRRVA